MQRIAHTACDALLRLHPREGWRRAEERRPRLTLGDDWVQRRLAGATGAARAARAGDPAHSRVPLRVTGDAL